MKKKRKNLQLHALPLSWSEEEKVRLRRKVIEKISGADLAKIPEGVECLRKASGHNIEQEFGTAVVPLGITGPLLLHGERAKGEFLVPLATTEGALVASVNRGMKAIRQSGGARVRVEELGITRAPVFRVEDLNEAGKLENWIGDNRLELEKVVKATSGHIELLDFQGQLVGKSYFLRLSFNTQEAMGMNMASKAAEAVCQVIQKKTKVKCISLSGNYCVDKKAAGINVLKGRGKRAWAEVVIEDRVLKKTLKTDTDSLVEVFLRKIFTGSALAGSMGFNAHYANVAAALFLATGQDMAHVVEASLGITTVEKEKNGVYLSVYLPSLVLGTVGGGTGLPSQNSCLQILGLGRKKAGEAKKLAEITAGAILAGEISLLAALANSDLARAHQKFGRSRETKK